MAYFKDTTVDEQDYLVILNNEKQTLERRTHLKVYKSLIGTYASEWPKFTNPLHESGWTREVNATKTPVLWSLQCAHHRQTKETSPLPTLGRSIVEGSAKWGDKTEFLGEFHHIVGYWEWSEDILSHYGKELRRVGIYDSVYASLFTYDQNTEVMKAFCEAWCPSTNTLLTSSGELSISLWDLHYLSGLPSLGTLYDEVVPRTRELLGMSRDKLHIPMSCRYLLHAYHLLGKSNNGFQNRPVTIEAWIKFWSKKSLRYQPSPPRKEKKSGRPKSTHNPTGDIKSHEPWTSIEKALFAKLDVKDRNWDETYLAAYIACWLCVFVLPDDDTKVIRPTTFKMASMMANGKTISLTIPVLASIFRGLNLISNSQKPSEVRAVFPIHFVYGWMSHYFKTHFPLERDFCIPSMIQYSGEGGARYYDHSEARRRVHKWDLISWNCTMLTKNKDIVYIDTEQAVESQRCYFMAIRSNYLTQRLDDGFILEPYSPHRFSRQFGYYQDVPGILTQDIRKASLTDGIKYWRACSLYKSKSRARFPSLTSNAKKLCSIAYRNWWDQAYKNFIDDELPTLTQKAIDVFEEQDKPIEVSHSDGKRKATPIVSDSASDNEHCWRHEKRAKSQELINDHVESDHHQSNAVAYEVIKSLGMDDEEDSQDSHASAELDQPKETPILDKQVRRPQLGAVSEFYGSNTIDDELRLFLQRIWYKLRSKMTRTEADFISSIEDEIRSGFSRMKSFKSNFDLSYVENSINTFFARAIDYDKERSASREIGEISAQQHQKDKARLREVRAKEKVDAATLESDKKELAELERRKNELASSVKKQQEALQVIHADIKELKEKVDKFKNAPLIDDEVLENLKNAKVLLEAAQQSLKDQDPFA